MEGDIIEGIFYIAAEGPTKFSAGGRLAAWLRTISAVFENPANFFTNKNFAIRPISAVFKNPANFFTNKNLA